MSIEATGFLLFAVIALVVYACVHAANLPPDAERTRVGNEMKFGILNPALHCQHCNTTGQVRTKGITAKAGVSGGKAAAGLMTGGASLLVTGLSRKEHLTQAHCDVCNITWTIA